MALSQCIDSISKNGVNGDYFYVDYVLRMTNSPH